MALEGIVVVPSPSLEETRRALVDVAHGRFGEIPGPVIVDHVLRMTTDADGAVRAAALEALCRRWGFARRDGLAIASRPEGGVFGAYATRRKAPRDRPRRHAEEPRPYTSLLENVQPIVGSCDCFDFVRGSLGLCKHLLVVLEDLFSSPKRLEKALRLQVTRTLPPGPRLVWDPGIALVGDLDRLTTLRLEAGGDPAATRAPAWARLKRAFGHGVLESVRLDPERRRELLLSLCDPLGTRTWLDATPAAEAIVREELERVDRALRCVAARPAALETLSTLARQLYPYQREGVERFLAAGRMLLADDMGLGKTTQAIASAHALFESKRIDRGLVIVPASLKPQWHREWIETTAVPIVVVDGSPDERVVQYGKVDRGFALLSYEQLLRDADAIHAMAPDFVVLDEAQRIRNYATKSAAYVKALTPEYRLVLTGTPMENRLDELASILDWVDDVALAPKWRLTPWYTASGSSESGARNLDTLRARLRPSVVRRVRKEVLAQLPPRTDTRVPAAMTAQQTAAHDELAPRIASLVQSKRALTQPEFLRLMQLLTQQRIIANGLGQLRFEELWPTYQHARPDAALLEGLFAPKLLELRRLVTDLVVGQGRKAVVFSQWRRMLRLAEWSVRDILADAGVRGVFFTGAEKASERTRNVAAFHDEPQVGIMFLSDAGGVGLNLQEAASACINLELPWNPAVLEQRVGRIYRLGQSRPIDVYNLVSETSIEGRIAGLLDAKQALFDGLFDGTSDEVRFDTASSFRGRMERLVGASLILETEPPSDPFEEGDVDVTDEAPHDAASTDAAISDELPSVVASPPLVGGGDGLRTLFASLRVERTADGGVRIEAPPAVASELVALFEGMAKLFR